MALWTDPTDYAANAIPTTSGAETININTKLVAKVRQLYDYLVGDDNTTFLLTAQANTDFKIKLGDTLGVNMFTLLGSAGGTVVQIDSHGQLRAGYLDAQVLAVQIPGNSVTGTKINNIRLLAPYTFTANELAMSCDDTLAPSGSPGSLTYRVVNSTAGTLGTIRIIAGAASAGTVMTTPVSCTKDSVFTYDCVTIGATNPGRDVNIQIRGYRTGTIKP